MSEMVCYLGRMVEKKTFRAFVHSPDGRKMLAESWDEYTRCLSSGTWFSSIDEAQAASPDRKSPSKRKPSTVREK